MDAVKNDVKRLVKIELAAANKKFRMFAGPHEGAGIIQEEVVEAVQEMNGLRQELNPAADRDHPPSVHRTER